MCILYGGSNYCGVGTKLMYSVSYVCGIDIRTQNSNVLCFLYVERKYKPMRGCSGIGNQIHR